MKEERKTEATRKTQRGGEREGEWGEKREVYEGERRERERQGDTGRVYGSGGGSKGLCRGGEGWYG